MAERRTPRRIILKIAYDGTNFCGWQIQPEGRTVQGEIERALKIILREKIKLVSSARTDTGVHARFQIVNFDTYSEITLVRLCLGLNGIIDRDVSVLNAYEGPTNFHARFDAVEREYRYYFYNYPQRSPFMEKRAYWIPQKMDLEKMQKSLNYLIGEHDFASFCKTISKDKGTIRQISLAQVYREGDYVIMQIKSNAFLHNMIRIIAGTLVEIERNDWPAEKMREILAGKDRQFGGPTAPPFALYLNDIIYKFDLETLEKAF